MQSKIIAITTAVLVLGISQFAFAEEIEVTHIVVDNEVFDQPKSKYNFQEMKITGFIEDYSRGEQITITTIYPDESEGEINTYASKKGNIYTILHITHDSQIGVHQVVLKYHGVEQSRTTFEILANQ